MNKNKELFDDFIKLAGSAMDTACGSAHGLKEKFDETINEKIDNILKDRGYVTREEFDVLKKMVEKLTLELNNKND